MNAWKVFEALSWVLIFLVLSTIVYTASPAASPPTIAALGASIIGLYIIIKHGEKALSSESPSNPPRDVVLDDGHDG